MNSPSPARSDASHLGCTPDTESSVMNAAVYRRFGPPEVVKIEETPKPRPKANEVLVKVHASTVSAADRRGRSRTVPRGLGVLASFGLGTFRPRHRILGMDIAGVVEAVGPRVTTFQPGDEVIAMLGGSFGGHAEYVCVKEGTAITAKPRNVGFDEAVALVFGGITAWSYLNQVTIKPGDTVLVNGASGAVGTAVVQLANTLGAHVTGVCSAANRDLVLSLHADRVIDYTTSDFTTEGRTYDVLVDCVGNASFSRVGNLINPGGALLLITTNLAGLVQAPMQSRRTGKSIIVSGGAYEAAYLASLARLADWGLVVPVIDRSYKFTDIVQAHRYVDTGHKMGNVVLRIANAAV